MKIKGRYYKDDYLATPAELNVLVPVGNLSLVRHAAKTKGQTTHHFARVAIDERVKRLIPEAYVTHRGAKMTIHATIGEIERLKRIAEHSRRDMYPFTNTGRVGNSPISRFFSHMVERKAQETLLDQRSFKLSPTGMAKLQRLLRNPPEPTSALVALMRAPAPWK